jgi:hypothetical protein
VRERKARTVALNPPKKLRKTQKSVELVVCSGWVQIAREKEVFEKSGDLAIYKK